jgi:hypothetical protein
VLRSLARAGAVAALAACAGALPASPARADDCVTVDGDPVLCVGADAAPTVDPSSSLTVALVVDVDVCSTLVPSAPTCTPGRATVAVGRTGLSGVRLSSGPTGGNVVRVPEVCLNTTCVGPAEYPLPTVDAPCVETGIPMIIVDGRDSVSLEWLTTSGTCRS